MSSGSKLKRYAPAGLGLLLAVYVVATGLWTLRQDEQGVVTRFGRVARVVAPGVHLTLPWPLERMHRVSTTEVRRIPLTLDVAALGDDAQWMTGDTNLFAMKVDVQYVVDDPAAYLFSAADLDAPVPGASADESDAGGTVRTARDGTIAAAARSELTRLAAGMRIDEALSSGKAALQREAKLGTQALCEELGLGLRILSVNVAEARPPAGIIAAFNDVSSAESDRERLASESDGYRRDLLPRERSRANRIRQEAAVYKDAVVSAASGSAARFEDLAREVAAAPEISRQRLWLDMATEVFGSARLILYPVDGGNPEREFSLRVVE